MFNELAEKYTPTGKVTFATLDWTHNDVHGVKVDETPTVLLFKKGNEENIRYKGAIKKKNFEEFIQKKLKINLEQQEQDL